MANMQLFLNNFTGVFVATVKATPVTGTPATELDYGILRLSDGVAGVLLNPTAGDYYILTAFKKSGTVESSIEIMRVTNVNNGTPGECRVTVLRGQEGTAPQGYIAGDYVAMRWTKGGVANLLQAQANLSDLPSIPAAKTTLALENVNNTSDANKPVSSAQAAADALKQDLTGKDASNGYAGLTLFKLNLRNAANTLTNFLTNASTNVRTWTLQDRSGILADDIDLALKANLDSPNFTGTVGGISKTMVGLPNVDNTSDANKPVSTAQAAADATKAAKGANSDITSLAGLTTPLSVAQGGTAGTTPATSRAALGAELEAGAVMPFARNTAPSGWLKANGALISRTTYAALFAAIGTTFGVGDGSTTFAVPDLRGEFLRGWDDGRGVDATRAIGTAQSDAFQGHSHDITGYTGAYTEEGLGPNRGSTAAANPAGMAIGNPKAFANGVPRIGDETRPRNIALLACIKY